MATTRLRLVAIATGNGHPGHRTVFVELVLRQRDPSETALPSDVETYRIADQARRSDATSTTAPGASGLLRNHPLSTASRLPGAKAVVREADGHP